MSIEANPYGRVYTKTTLQGNAHAILGDSHTHHHYYGALSELRADKHGSNTTYATSYDAQVAAYRREIPLDLISDYDAVLAHWLRQEARLPDTCNWIFSVPEYKRWKNGAGPAVFVCTGSVGCGKSVTAGAVLDALQDDARRNDRLVISYFIDSLSADKLRVDDILRAIIKQLVIARRNVNCTTDTYLEDRLRALFVKPTSVPSFSNLLQLVKDLSQETRQACLLLDGIDALTEDAIIRLIKVIKGLTESSQTDKPGFRIVIFCRESLGRGIRFEDEHLFQTFQIALEHVQKDVHAFVDQQTLTKQDERCLVQSAELLQEIVRVLKANSARIFLWVKLQIATIWDPDFALSEADIREQLQHLPEGLDQIYTQCLRRIEATHQKRSSEIAPKAFKWIATAARPLTQTEAKELVSMEPGEYSSAPEKALSLPITDYCCNLVVVNPLTGRLEFAHTTVRDFLCDAKKLPIDLQRFSLKTPDTELWCAYTLLSYIHHYRSKDQLVRLRQQKIPTNNPILPISPVVENARNPDHVTLAMGNITKHQNLWSSQFEVHDYIRVYWLSHTKQVRPGTNPVFEDLCLSQDPEFLPWAASTATQTENLKLAIAYAVTTNHIALFNVIWNQTSRKGLQDHLRKTPCPGTHSSYMHIAAALGHEEVAVELVRHGFGGVADSDGKSAATIALEAGRLSLFAYLLSGLHFRPVDALFSELTPIHDMLGLDSKSVSITENILLSAARTNDIYALHTMVQRYRWPRKYLSRAVFDACQYGNVGFARELIRLGANPYEWYDIAKDESLVRRYRRSALWQCVIDGQPQVLANLFDAGVSLAWITPSFDVVDVVKIWSGQSPTTAEKLVRVLAKHSASGMGSDISTRLPLVPPALPKYLFPRRVVDLILSYLDNKSRKKAQPFLIYLSDLCTLEDPNTHCTISDDIYQTPWLERYVATMNSQTRVAEYGSYLRIMLSTLSSPQVEPNQSFFRSPYIWKCLRPSRAGKPSIATFLQYATDDVLIRVLRARLLNPNYLCSEHAFDQIVRRKTTRALQAFANTYLRREHRKAIAMLCDTYVPENLLTSSPVKYFLTMDSGHCLIYRRTSQATVLLTTRSKRHLVRRLVSPETRSTLGSRRRDKTYYNGVKALMREMQLSTFTEKLCLLRCCRRAKDVHHLKLLYQEMQKCHSDANFALNFPAGYVRRVNVPKDPRFPGIEWAISKHITHAVYAWNFRLRRKLKLPFSQADVWLMGSMLANHFLNLNTVTREPFQTVDLFCGQRNAFESVVEATAEHGAYTYVSDIGGQGQLAEDAAEQHGNWM